MTHPREHQTDPLYWAWFLAGMIQHALERLNEHESSHAETELADALADFRDSPIYKQHTRTAA